MKLVTFYFADATRAWRVDYVLEEGRAFQPHGYIFADPVPWTAVVYAMAKPIPRA